MVAKKTLEDIVSAVTTDGERFKINGSQLAGVDPLQFDEAVRQWVASGGGPGFVLYRPPHEKFFPEHKRVLLDLVYAERRIATQQPPNS